MCPDWQRLHHLGLACAMRLNHQSAPFRPRTISPDTVNKRPAVLSLGCALGVSAGARLLLCGWITGRLELLREPLGAAPITLHVIGCQGCP